MAKKTRAQLKKSPLSEVLQKPDYQRTFARFDSRSKLISTAISRIKNGEQAKLDSEKRF